MNNTQLRRLEVKLELERGKLLAHVPVLACGHARLVLRFLLARTRDNHAPV